MTARRPVKKGSFGSHFDELIKHFVGDHPPRPAKPKGSDCDPRSVHDRLLERAWRDAVQSGRSHRH